MLAATLSGQVFDDLNGDQIWQASAPQNEPALDCWTVFLDNNKNGVLDQGEPQQLTTANGTYSFDLATAGEYTVELVQEPGFDRTKPIRFGLSTNSVAGNVQDHVFDPIRKVLYGTNGDRVLRTNPQTGETLAALAFGSSLTSIDITPDGKYLLVGESATSGGVGTVFKIDLSTNAVTPINYSLAGQEGGVFDIAAVSNERALFTTTSSTTDRVPLREVNLTTNVVTTRAETFGAGAGEVLPQSRLERNSTRTALLLVAAHDPTGPIHLYESATNGFVRSGELADTLDEAHLAISRDGKRIAIQSSGLGLKVYDDQFALITTLPHFRGGIAFDSVRNIFYAGDTEKDELVAIDTTTWNELYRVAIGEDLPASGTYYEMQANARAKYLSVTTPAGVRYVQLDRPIPHVVTVTGNQTIDHLDFGNWVNGDNRRPTAVTDNYSIAEDQSLNISAAGVLANDTDPDGNSLEAQFVAGPQHGSVSLFSNGSFLYSPIGDYFGADSFTYRAYDGTLTSCRTATVHVNVTPVNDAPSDISLTGTAVDENAAGAEIGEVVVVDADQNDQITLQVSDARIEIVNGRLRLRDGQSLDHEQGTTIDVTVTATDNASPPLSISEVFTIDVNDINEFDPTVVTTTIETPEDSTTVGTVQTQDGDSSQSTQITIVGGNDGDVFSIDPNTGVITVNTGHQLDHEGTQIHVLTVSVSDSIEPKRTTTADVTISVTDVNESDPNIEPAVFEIAENSPNGTTVGQVVATDADTGQSLTYSISDGNGDGIFAIDSATGVITVADESQLDRELTAQIVLVVQVADSGSPSRTDSADVTINLTNVNEFDPTILHNVVIIDENVPNDTVVAVYQVDDPDAVSDLVYSITGGNTGGAFSIDGQTGEIRVANSSALDVETNERIVLAITATDQLSPVRSGTGSVRFDLRDINEFDPTLSDESFKVAEDAPIGYEVGTVTATDQDQTHVFEYDILSGNDLGIFAIDSSTGVITVANNTPLENAADSQYPLTISVSDGGVPVRSTNADVTISVVPANENSPTANDVEFSLAENSANGTVVGSVVATDPDPGTSFTYSITGGNANGVFAINATSGQITVADDGDLDYESVTKFTLTVLVDDGGTPSKTDEAQVTINLTDVNEFAPTLSDITITIPENAANGTVVGTVTAADSDAGQTVTYSITGGAFAIHPTTGVVTVADASQLNFESATSVVASVTATDSGSPSKSATANLTANLTDVNEATPVVTNATLSIDENRPAGTVLGRVTATDADTRQTLSYSLGGGNVGGAFTINSATGEITVANATIINAEAVPQFLLLVNVSDNGSPQRTAIGTMTVHVQGINEPPTGVTLAGDVVPEHLSGHKIGLVTVIDPDAGDLHTFSVDDGRFTVDANRMLKLNDGQALNLSAGSSIPIQVTASDSSGLTASQNFVIHVASNPTPWRNVDNPLDVNGDGLITPSDVLRVINEINNPRTTDLRGRLPTERPDIPDLPFYDVNGDGLVTPIDVLMIINELNRRGNQAEGEAGFVRMPQSNATAPESGKLVNAIVLPPVSSLATSKPTKSAIRRRDLDDLEDTLDDLAADIASAWGAGV